MMLAWRARGASFASISVPVSAARVNDSNRERIDSSVISLANKTFRPASVGDSSSEPDASASGAQEGDVELVVDCERGDDESEDASELTLRDEWHASAMLFGKRVAGPWPVQRGVLVAVACDSCATFREESRLGRMSSRGGSWCTTETRKVSTGKSILLLTSDWLADGRGVTHACRACSASANDKGERRACTSTSLSTVIRGRVAAMDGLRARFELGHSYSSMSSGS